MMFLAAFFLCAAFVGLAYVGIKDARANLRRFDEQFAGDGFASTYTDLDALEEAQFSASLLSLSKVPQLTKHSSSEPVLDESSSLALVRPFQSKSQTRES